MVNRSPVTGLPIAQDVTGNLRINMGPRKYFLLQQDAAKVLLAPF